MERLDVRILRDKYKIELQIINRNDRDVEVVCLAFYSFQKEVPDSERLLSKPVYEAMGSARTIDVHKRIKPRALVGWSFDGKEDVLSDISWFTINWYTDNGKEYWYTDKDGNRSSASYFVKDVECAIS